MEDLELQKIILLRIKDISDKLHFIDLTRHELKQTYRTIDISGLGYLKERFLSYFDLLNIKRYESSLFKPDYELVEAGELDPDQIHTPGIYVHRIFQGENYEKRIEQRTVRSKI